MVGCGGNNTEARGYIGWGHRSGWKEWEEADYLWEMMKVEES